MSNKEELNDALDKANKSIKQLAAMIEVFANDDGRRDWALDTEAWYVETFSMLAKQAETDVNNMYQYV